MNRQASCEERVQENFEGRMEDLRQLWDTYKLCPDAYHEDLGNMYEFGLGFWYVPPGTYDDQREGWFCYQLSTGGPGDEFRIFADKAGTWAWSVYRIEYWFLDWFDGAKHDLAGTDFDLLEEIFTCFFVDAGSADHEYDRAMQEVITY